MTLTTGATTAFTPLRSMRSIWSWRILWIPTRRLMASNLLGISVSEHGGTWGGVSSGQWCAQAAYEQEEQQKADAAKGFENVSANHFDGCWWPWDCFAGSWPLRFPKKIVALNSPLITSDGPWSSRLLRGRIQDRPCLTRMNITKYKETEKNLKVTILTNKTWTLGQELKEA